MATTRREWSASARTIERRDVGECCPRQPYLELIVPEHAKSVEKVTITTISHDQGWSDFTHLKGTYSLSTSFFEVGVLTPFNHERARRIRFQDNVHAVAQPRKHVNTWTLESDETKKAWLKSIQPGDIIQVIPVAILPAWANFIYEAEIQAEGEAMSKDLTVASAKEVPAEKTRIYKPLNVSQREIRILVLNPGTFEDPLQCSIKTVSLDDPDRDHYQALSYCWGNSIDYSNNPLHVISSAHGDSADNELFEMDISDNLYNALKHLRPKDGHPLKLWVDAVCIDQSDLEERSLQVSVMRPIYALADKVVVWLGTSNKAREDIFEVMARAQGALLEGYSKMETSTADELDIMEKKLVYEQMEHKVGFIVNWNGCGFDWFNRSWVLQEIANAKTAVVRCGPDEVPWQVVSILMHALDMENILSDFIQGGSVPQVVSGDTMVPLIFTRLIQKSSPEPTFHMGIVHKGILEVVIMSHALKATDPRDKIFALLQFGTETKDTNSLPLAMQPDYTKPVRDVYTDFVRWWICEHRSLRILSAVHTLKYRTWQQMYSGFPIELKELGYPSWCFWYTGNPDWAGSSLGLSLRSPYRASRDTAPDFDLIMSEDALKQSHVLQLKGHRLCTIDEIMPFRWDESNEISELENAFIEVFDPACQRKAFLPDGTVRTEFDQMMGNFIQRHSNYHRDGFSRGQISFPCMSHCLFRAGRNGSAVRGLCPHNARPGDIVAMLYGGGVCYLLREKMVGRDNNEKNGQMEFVGECLLEGFMHGKALAETENLEKEVFDLV